LKTEKLIEKRKLAGLSQAAVAGKLKCTPSAVNQYENGKRKPSFDVVIKLAEIYGCSVNDFV
jgi:transcriptional regulator with XRE-family HTH domain